MEKLKSLMQLMVYIIIDYYTSKMITWDTQEHLKENLSIIFQYVTFFFLLSSFLLPLFKLSCTKEHHIYNLYRISYTLGFCCVMYSKVLEICIDGHFLEDCFYCYFQQNISAAANESLIPYNLIKRAPKTQNF